MTMRDGQRRAWLVTWLVDEDINGIIAATSRGAARFAAWKSAKEVGYTSGFGDFHVRRSPRHDGWAATTKHRDGMVIVDVVEQEMAP